MDRKNRSWIEIIADILRLGEARKSLIMHFAGLSYERLKKYLTFLTEKGYLEEVSQNGMLYRTTEEGYRVLRKIDDLLETLKDSQ